MPTLKIDGQEITVEPGTTVIEAARQLGIVIPHYCWHPGLSIAGNCRICQVEVVSPRMRFPCTIACNLPCGDGMEILTDSEAAKKYRADVMEFLLINHPLDCPICDQAGECVLQEYSFAYGHDTSRFDEEKVHKSKRIRFSDKVTFDAERCILCTRCVRFCEEIVGEEELCVVERGDHGEIAVAHGRELENPYSMNVIDLCPVGALTSTDFRFKSRVWFLTNTPSVCTSCAKNCSITVGTRWDKIQRLTPRENMDVNRWWMCDHGRLSWKHVHGEDRLGGSYVRKDGKLRRTSLPNAVAKAHELVSGFVVAEGGDKVFGLVSARLTNEEILLARRYLAEVVGTGSVDLKRRIEGEDDDLLIRADKNPNTTGARLIGVGPVDAAVGLADLPRAVAEGRIKAALIFGDDLDDVPEALEALDALDFVVVMDFRATGTARKADVVLAGVTWAEKEGTLTNVDGWVSMLRPAIKPLREARPDLEILRDLLRAARPEESWPETPRDAFAALSDAVPAYAGLEYSELGTKSLKVAEEAVSAAD